MMGEVANLLNLTCPSSVRSAELPFQTTVDGSGIHENSLEGFSGWRVFFSLVILSITYDQCLFSHFCDFLLER